MHGVPLPRPVRAGGGAQSRPIRAGRCPVERAPLAAQHCPAHGCGPQADCQVQKKRLLLRRPCCRGARPKPSASGGKCSGSMSGGALWAPKDEKCGAGWLSTAPGGALGASGWAAGAKPRCASGGSRCRRITANIVGFSPTSGKPTPRSCRAGSTGPAPKARSRPASSRPLIVPSPSAAACSCASPARSASRWPCTRPELKL